MNNLKSIFLLFLIVVFLVGLYLYAFDLLRVDLLQESMSNDRNADSNSSSSSKCPDLLINKGNSLLLYNTKLPETNDGTNPMPFYSLDEYIQYLEIQKKKGIHCPVLYLQKENDTQGNDVYRVRPSPFNQQGGLPPTMTMTRSEYNHQDIQKGPPPNLLMQSTANLDRTKPTPILDANRDQPPYNSGNYPGFDPQNLYVGTYTTIDQVHDSTETAGPISDNPLDTNWGGVLYTEKVVASGKYDENNVLIKAA